MPPSATMDLVAHAAMIAIFCLLGRVVVCFRGPLSGTPCRVLGISETGAGTTYPLPIWFWALAKVRARRTMVLSATLLQFHTQLLCRSVLLKFR